MLIKHSLDKWDYTTKNKYHDRLAYNDTKVILYSHTVSFSNFAYVLAKSFEIFLHHKQGNNRVNLLELLYRTTEYTQSGKHWASCKTEMAENKQINANNKTDIYFSLYYTTDTGLHGRTLHSH